MNPLLLSSFTAAHLSALAEKGKLYVITLQKSNSG
jgi:hypothetical protein